MVASHHHRWSTTGRSTVGQLIHELRTHDPDQEVVFSTDSLPWGAARICVVKTHENDAAGDANTLVRYCRNVDVEAASATENYDQPRATPRRRTIICPPVAVDGAVGGATVLQGPWATAVA